MWACFDLPQLALDGVLRRRADSHAPLVLVDGPAHGRVVVAANEAAARAGLRAGQRLAAAQALLARFEMVAFDAEESRRWHRFLAAVAYRYSSEVVLLPQAVALEVSRSMRLFGPWPRFAARLREDLAQLGFRHRLAAAPTPQAAQVLAAWRDGTAAFGAAALGEALQPVPVPQAGLPEAAAAGLPAMGLRTLGQVLRTPRDGLRRRFGEALPEALERLLGERPDGLERFRPPDLFEWRLELSHEVENVAALIFPLRRLTGDLAAYLAGRDGGVQRFLLQLEHRQAAPTAVPVGLLAPERDPAMLFELARGRLESLQLAGPVLAMRLVAEDLPPFMPARRDLFDQRPAQALSMARLRERLRARLGDAAVYRWGDTVDPRPERAQARNAPILDRAEPLPRPSWLLERPIPLRGPPPRIVAGPERLETGWWDGGAVRRDYYVVETALGQWAWAFCAPGEQRGWMLHGWFA